MDTCARPGSRWARLPHAGLAGNRPLCAFLLCKSCFIRDIDLCGPTACFPGAYALSALSWAHLCVGGVAGGCNTGLQRSTSRIKHDLHRRNAQSAHSPAKPACGSRAQRLPGRAHVPMTGHARHTRLGTRLYRSAEVAVLKFRGWRVCARCHRNKKNLRAVLRSGSELVSLSDRILLLVACRPHVCVKRACAVGIARRGAQIGRLRAPCKAGGHC